MAIFNSYVSLPEGISNHNISETWNPAFPSVDAKKNQSDILGSIGLENWIIHFVDSTCLIKGFWKKGTGKNPHFPKALKNMTWPRIVYIPDFQRHPHHVVGSSIMFYPDYI
jgi:hypothetical protein